MIRDLRRVALLICLAAAVPLRVEGQGSDPPHWIGQSGAFTQGCTVECHSTHHASGGVLTDYTNVNLCLSCHNAAGSAAGEPFNPNDSAIPGARGSSHAFGATAINASYGATTPTNVEMALRVMNGQIVCSTCHDQHSASSATGGTVKLEVGWVAKLTSTGNVTVGGPFIGTEGFFYLIDITTAGNLGVARFRWSKDNGATWMASNILTAVGPLALDNGVTVSFSAGTYVVGARWEITATRPFLRAPLDTGVNTTGTRFCRDCHAGWEMDHTAAETYTGTARSHPVGVALNANGRGYDRVGAILDGNGAVQGSGSADSNASNDFTLDAGRVQCLTCHAVHFVDSNTQTVDGP